MLSKNSWHHTTILITPHTSLSFSQQDIKHVGVCGSSANFPQKTFPEKIMQNKVCICPKLCMYGSEFFLTMSLVFRKAESEMSDKSKTPDKLEKFLAGGDIILNCFIPGEGVNDIFEVTISNANDNRVSSLAEAIRNRRLDRFQDIDSTRLALYKVGFICNSVVIHNLSNNEYYEVKGAERMEPQIFSHFPIQPQLKFSGEEGINVISVSFN